MVTIKISNKAVYTFIAMIIFIAVIGLAYAYGGSTPSVIGHNSGEIDFSEGINFPIFAGSDWAKIYTEGENDNGEFHIYIADNPGDKVIIEGKNQDGEITPIAEFSLKDGICMGGSCVKDWYSVPTSDTTPFECDEAHEGAIFACTEHVGIRGTVVCLCTDRENKYQWWLLHDHNLGCPCAY